MDSLYFLKKLYKTSKCAVFIVDTTNKHFWSTNLHLISSTDEEMRSEASVKFFGAKPCDLFPGQGVANIHGNQYTYNVKTYSDRSLEYIILEIRTESTTTDFIKSDNINKLSDYTSSSLQKNTSNIVSIINNAYSNRSRITLNDYNTIISSVRQILSTSNNLSNLHEIQEQVKLTFAEKVSLSEVALKFADDCNALLKPYGISAEIDCVENVKGYISESIFYNLSVSMLNRLLAMTGGYVSNISVDIEMFSNDTAEYSIILKNKDEKCKVGDLNTLNEINERECVFGTDLFFIKEFCNNFHSEAILRTNEKEHNYAITLKIPRCTADEIGIFKCESVVPEYVNKFSKLSIGLSEFMSLLTK